MTTNNDICKKETAIQNVCNQLINGEEVCRWSVLGRIEAIRNELGARGVNFQLYQTKLQALEESAKQSL